MKLRLFIIILTILTVSINKTSSNEPFVVLDYNQANGKLYANPITASSGDAYGATWTTNDVIGVAIDMTNGGDPKKDFPVLEVAEAKKYYGNCVCKADSLD